MKCSPPMLRDKETEALRDKVICVRLYLQLVVGA